MTVEHLDNIISVITKASGSRPRLIVMHPNDFKEFIKILFLNGNPLKWRHEKLEYSSVKILRSYDVTEGDYEFAAANCHFIDVTTAGGRSYGKRFDRKLEELQQQINSLKLTNGTD